MSDMSILIPTKDYVPAAPVHFRGGVPRRANAISRVGGTAAVLRDAILAGEFAPGERLFEQAVGERLGVSRTPVREAFRTLIGEGLVEMDANGRVFVASADENEAAEARAVMIELEVLAVEFAVQRMSWSAIEAFGRQVRALESCVRRRDWSGATAVERALHAHIVEHSENTALIKAWVALSAKVRSAASDAPDERDWEGVVRAFQDIDAALRERSAPRAAERLRAHV